MNCQRLAAAIRDVPKRMSMSIPTVGQASILTSPSSTILIKEESAIKAISASIENILFRISIVLLLILLVTVFLLWRLAGKSGDADDDDANNDANNDANDGKMNNFVVVVVLFAGD